MKPKSIFQSYGRSSVVTTTFILIQAVKGDELLLKFRDGPESVTALRANAAMGAEAVKTFQAIGWQRVKLPEGMSVEDGLMAYRKLDCVVMAEGNRVGGGELGRGTPESKAPALLTAAAA